MKKVLDHIFMLYIPLAMVFMVFESILQFYVALDDEWGGFFLNVAGILAILLIAGYIANTIAFIIIHCRKEKEK